MDKRVVYTNVLDGQRRVLCGDLSEGNAAVVAEQFGQPGSLLYMGPVEIEDCDGTPDGEIVGPKVVS